MAWEAILSTPPATVLTARGAEPQLSTGPWHESASKGEGVPWLSQSQPGDFIETWGKGLFLTQQPSFSSQSPDIMMTVEDGKVGCPTGPKPFALGFASAWQPTGGQALGSHSRWG